MEISSPAGAKRAQSLLIVVVFLVFLVNALSLLNIQVGAGGTVRLHRQLLADLLEGRLSAVLLGIDFLTFIGVSVVLTAWLPRLSPVSASLLTFAAMLPPFYVAWAFPVPPANVPLEYTLLTVLVLFAVNVLISYFIETHERQKILAAFGQYVPPALVSEISRHPLAHTMAGQARELSVLFCDIRGFSGIAETLEPHELARLLNHYLSAMTAVLHRHGATIDKYIGDAIMAFWGAPLRQDDHARRAVAAALDMQSHMKVVREDCARLAWPRLEIGIGINSGMMSVGNMGSRYRVAYTVLGDAVNVAARLEALTRYYGAAIVISEATRAACPDTACRELDHVRVKGKGRATRLYEPLPAEPLDAARESRHQAALNAYYGGDWDDARRLFAGLCEQASNPAYYEVMLARIADRARPPEWNGVVSFGGEFSYSFGPSDPPS